MTDLVIIDDNAAKKTAKYLGMTVDGYVRSFARGKKVWSNFQYYDKRGLTALKKIFQRGIINNE